MRGWSLVMALVTVAGCDNLHPNPDGIRGGSRIEARFVEAEGGARELMALHDRDLDVDCGFWGDPVRCYPYAAGISGYADADCTRPLASVSTAAGCPGELPRMVAQYSEECGAVVDHLWEVGDAVEVSQVFGLDVDGACVAGLPQPDTEYHAMARELGIDELLGAHYETESSGIGLRVLIGDDGTRLPSGPWDTAADHELWELGDTLVPAFQYASFSAESTCTTPASVSGPCGARPDFLATWTPPTGCDAPGHYDLYENDGAFAGRTLYMPDNACGPIDLGPDDQPWIAGAPASFDYPALARVTDGTARIRPYFVEAGSYRRRTWGMFDSELGVDCNPQQIASDEWRCVPVDVPSSEAVFTDPACQTLVDVVPFYVDPCGGGPSAPRAVIVPGMPAEDSCSYRNELHAVGEKLPHIYGMSLDACTEVVTDVDYYAVGQDIGWDDYALLRETAD